jgi:hypothetical protein
MTNSIRKKIMVPSLQGSNQKKSLSLVGIIQGGTTKLFTKVCNGVPLLQQNRTNSHIRGITFNLKGFGKIR